MERYTGDIVYEFFSGNKIFYNTSYFVSNLINFKMAKSRKNYKITYTMITSTQIVDYIGDIVGFTTTYAISACHH
jgi:hypothetical protein